MKEKIKAAIQNKYSKLGLGTKAIEAAAAYLEASIKEDSEIENVVVGIEPLLKAFQSEADTIRSSKSAAEKKAAEFEAKIKELAGVQNIPVETKNEDVPSWAKAILDSSKKLESDLLAIKGDKIVNDRKTKLNAIIEKLPEAIRKPYQRMDVKSLTDDDFETLTSEVSAEVEVLSKEVLAQGAVFGRPKATATPVKKSSDIPQEQLNEILSGIADVKAEK